MNSKHDRMFLVFCAAAATAACGVPAESGISTDERQEEVTRILGAHGFNTSTLVFRGEEVIVEGDMVFEVNAILEQGSEDVEKGYFHGFYAFSAKAPSVAHLVLASDLPNAWRTAFTAAAAEWSTVPGISINQGTPTTAFLNVRFDPLFTSLNPPVLDTQTFAVGYFPPWPNSGGLRTGKIVVNSAYTGACFSGPNAAAQRRHTALHEIGHTLGFKHPGEGVHIPGTSAGTAYTTVMRQGCLTLTSLSGDDENAAEIVY